MSQGSRSFGPFAWTALLGLSLALSSGCRAGEGDACAKPEDCASGLTCSASSHTCQTPKAIECEASEGCTTFGRCDLAAGGTECIATDRGCRASTGCRYNGLCRAAEDGRSCLATDDGCAATKPCRELGLCRAAGDGSECVAQEQAGAATAPGSAGPKPSAGSRGSCSEGTVRVPEGMDAWDVARTFSFGLPLDAPVAEQEAYEAAVFKNDLEAKVLAATTTEFYGKPLALVGSLELSTSYSGKYEDSKPTHYSFDFTQSGQGAGPSHPLRLYGDKGKFKRLFDLVAEETWDGPYRVRVITDESHRDDEVFTLLEAEPQAAPLRGLCAYQRDGG